jgi:hypothetical protein
VKDLETSCGGLIEVLSRRHLPQDTEVKHPENFRRTVVPTEIQTVYLRNTNIKCCRYDSLFRVSELDASFGTATATENGDEASCEGAGCVRVAQDRDQ